MDGDSNLGGRDFDHVLFEYCAEMVKTRFGKELKRDKLRSEKLKRRCEKIKIALSATVQERYAEIA